MGEGTLRRKGKEMPETAALDLLSHAKFAHFTTISPRGEPYVAPNLFVYADEAIWLHTSRARHFRSNVEHSPRICVEIAEMAEIYPCGDSSATPARATPALSSSATSRSCPSPKRKCCSSTASSPSMPIPRGIGRKGFYPRLDQVLSRGH